jgi:glycine/D-amino acid oxidase-like deaminating enzyme
MAAGFDGHPTRRNFLAAGAALAGGLLLPGLGGSPASADTIVPLEPLPDTTRIRVPDFNNRPLDALSFRAGVRPVRSSGIRIQKQVIGSGASRKIVVHNYGHGGAGITLSWGTAKRAVLLIEDAVREVLAAGQTPRIVVLGSGIVGLTTASELVSRWRQDWPRLDLTVRAKAFRDTTSFIAAGQFEPSVIFRTYADRGRSEELKEILRDSHKKLLDLGPEGRRRHGVSRRRNFSIARPIDAYDHRFMPAEIVPRPRFWSRFPFEGLSGMSGYEYETWLVNPTVMMPALREELTRAGVLFRIGDRRVVARAELAGLDANIIVNCTGIGSQLLFDDADLEGRRGHIVKLNNPRELRFLLSASCYEGMETMRTRRSAYVFCRPDSIIVGGSWTYDFDPADPVRVDPNQCRAILERMRAIMSGAVACPVTGTV